MEELVFMEQASERLRHALKELPERTRQVFLLHRLEGLRHEDVARRLDISDHTVANDITAALTHLRRALFPSEQL